MKDTVNLNDVFSVRSFGGSEVEVKLFSFGRFINFHDARAEMKNLGYEPADSIEAGSFSVRNLEVVKKFSIVALHVYYLVGEGASISFYDPVMEEPRQKNAQFHDFIFSTDYRFLGKKAN